MKRVLLVGEHPFSNTGNANMMAEFLAHIDYKKYLVCVYAANEPDITKIDPFNNLPYSIISSQVEDESFSPSKLLGLINSNNFDLILSVGIDVWRWSTSIKEIKKVQQIKRFQLGGIFPYDTPYLRNDWLNWLNAFDHLYIYSEFGTSLVKSKIERAKYFRPSLHNSHMFKPCSSEERFKTRRRVLGVDDDVFVFGYIGQNQFRKEPHKIVRAFFAAKKHFKGKSCLYMHTNVLKGAYNLNQIAADMGADTGDLLICHPNVKYNQEYIINLYQSFDCYVLPSMQEGLSWTILEAMLCGNPIIASNTTAHTELLSGIGHLVPCTTEAMLNSGTGTGTGQIPTLCCKTQDILDAMVGIRNNNDLQLELAKAGMLRGKDWIKNTDDPNKLLDGIFTTSINLIQKREVKKPHILFMQHSSAGDVLMTTRCFKGLKERHPESELHFMTSPQYQDIVINNPYITKILNWNPSKVNEYMYVYNPHGDRIAPGHWGRNCNSILSDFYWKLLDVEPDNFYIEEEFPEFLKEELNNCPSDPFCIVHTTGGDPKYRTYKYMGDVCRELKGRYVTIQLGGKNDYPAFADIDLRGKLNFRGSAWVMAKAKLAITVDSFISHLAGVKGISQVCLFGSGNQNVVKPNQVLGTLISMEPDYLKFCKGLGPCSGSVKDCPVTCTGLHDPKSIISNIGIIEEKENWL